MASLVDRLRVRSNRKPVDTDDSDEDDFFLEKHQTTEHLHVNHLTQVEKILDSEMHPLASDDPTSKQVLVKEYLVKWKGLSYMHCSWVPATDFNEAYKSIPHLKRRVEKFDSMKEPLSNNKDDYVAIRPEWTTIDRIISSRGEGDGREYLVKFKELPYDECCWESKSDISTFQTEIQRFKDINSGSRRNKYIAHERNHMDFTQFDHTPEFLTGMLHPYQLEGLNFLRYSWSNQTHVILADEMGLGKTIQSIAYLASLFEENNAPYLVVAPLTTLANWEREFATWAPHMNVVMYSGSSVARSLIRNYEFYFPKGRKTMNRQNSGEKKHERIKFDVVLISYELINQDTIFLKPIKWKCMIVDESHRLKNKDSKLFASLKQYSSQHRVLLTGTPLQNNLDELFMLMHFLDPEKFGSLEEFQKDFKDINKEEQISRLHKILCPHMLRRLKKDVLKNIPPKKEFILRVDLSSQQKKFYKTILTRNFQVLGKKDGGKVSNVLMELRKVCLHPYMLEGVEPDIEDSNEAFKILLESSGKMQLLDKLMVKLKEQGHKVLIFTQFQYMLDLLEDYCDYKKWLCERIDGKVGAAERQVRIDRFNAKTSNRFCFLLSTRAGSLGINLATADTVIIYDSDWNPHADLQAIARAHRLGQENTVMIYRLINRDTVEEKMMQMTRKKLLLEHLVVGKLKDENLSQEELDDIIRYGSKELFSKENEEEGKSGKIHYDDAAIEKLLDRDHVEAEDVSMNDVEENGFLKAFKVANFECIDEKEAAALEEAQAIEKKSPTDNLDRSNYWEELLKDKYETHQAEELNALGKRKRNCKQMLLAEEDDELVGLEVSSDEDCEIEPNEGDDDDEEEDEEEEVEQENRVGRKPYRRKTNDNVEAEQESRVGRKHYGRRNDDEEKVELGNQMDRKLTRRRKDDEEESIQRNQIGRKPTRKTTARDNSEPRPLMEGEGTSLKVLGFSVNQRRHFYQLVMRYGVGDYDWKEFETRIKKTNAEIKAYGKLFLKHLYEDINDYSPTYSDGVPKEGPKRKDILAKIAILKLIQEKVKFCEEHPTKPVFPDRILDEFPGLRGGQYWKGEHDKILLRVVLKHGYRKYEEITNDKNLGIQEIICKELGIPYAELIDAEQVAYGRELSLLDHYKDILKRLEVFMRNRGHLLEMAINYECAEEYYRPNGSSSLMCAGQVKSKTKVGVGVVEAYIEMLDRLHQPEMITVAEAVVDYKQEKLKVIQLYKKMCNLCESSRKATLTYFNRQWRSQEVKDSFKPLESINENMNMNMSLSVTSTNHDVEMRDSVQESTLESSNFIDLTMMEEEEEDAKYVDVKMREAHNVIVLD